LSMLVDRTFSGSNNYMIENSVKMMAVFAEMIIFDGRIGPIQQDRIGCMLAYQSVEKIKRFVGYSGTRQYGYLNLYIGHSNIIMVLRENSSFSQAVLDYLISLMDYLIEEEYIVKADVEDLGGLGRMIVGSSDQIADAVNHISSIMLLQNRIKAYLIINVKDDSRKQSEVAVMKEMILLIQHDIKSYKTIFMNRVPHNTVLGTLIDSFQKVL